MKNVDNVLLEISMKNLQMDAHNEGNPPEDLNEISLEENLEASVTIAESPTQDDKEGSELSHDEEGHGEDAIQRTTEVSSVESILVEQRQLVTGQQESGTQETDAQVHLHVYSETECE